MGQYRGNNASNTATRERHGPFPPMETYDFRAQRLFVPDDLADLAEIRLDRERAHYVGDVISPRRRQGDPSVQRPRRRMAGGARAGRQARRGAGVRGALAGADGAGRPRLRLRAAEARPARLYGAEGGGDGRRAAGAGADTAHPGEPGEPRAHARQCGRGGRAMRHPRRAGGAGAPPLRALAGRHRADAAHRVLRRGGGARRRAWRRWRMRPAARSRSRSGRRAASRTRSAARCRAHPGTLVLSLGPRILRADTAAVAALALVEAARQPAA